MKVLVVGSGGREHVLAWKLKQSPKVKHVICAPGNGGMAQIAECVAIKADDITGLVRFAQDQDIDLTVVGPEAPLVAGIVDAFEKAGLKIFGPNKAAAQLEGSKSFSKRFMKRHHIPTAAFETFTDADKARGYLLGAAYPLVVKADGLAAGKGVIICSNKDEALDAVDSIMTQRVFKEAGDSIVVEECLDGPEASILAISDGDNVVVLETSQDHKRIFDNDEGPNTGGMGAYSPAPVVTPALYEQIVQTVIKPTINGMKSDGTPFKGVLYAGLMLTADGPKVLEYNVRLGDPETQAVLPRLRTDLFDVLMAACEGRIKDVSLDWDPRTAVCVVVAAGGYPGQYDTGKEITGLDQAVSEDGVIFHAGTVANGEKVYTAGGRVLGITGFGSDVAEAIENTYRVVNKVHFEGCFFRRDIGRKALIEQGR
jgi:phosphoribosylamine--glycine ligase